MHQHCHVAPQLAQAWRPTAWRSPWPSTTTGESLPANLVSLLFRSMLTWQLLPLSIPPFRCHVAGPSEQGPGLLNETCSHGLLIGCRMGACCLATSMISSAVSGGLCMMYSSSLWRLRILMECLTVHWLFGNMLDLCCWIRTSAHDMQLLVA